MLLPFRETGLISSRLRIQSANEEEFDELDKSKDGYTGVSLAGIPGMDASATAANTGDNPNEKTIVKMMRSRKNDHIDAVDGRSGMRRIQILPHTE
jgi:hypothetical protein